MKKKVIIVLNLLALFLSQTVLSAPYCFYKPFYLGVELGGGNLHYDRSKLAKDTISVDDTGFAGRLLAGFDINQNIGLEMGYTHYQNPEFHYVHGIKADFSQQSLDFLAKLSLPVSCNLSVFAKAGLALVQRDDAEVVMDSAIIKVNHADDHLRPMLGAGVRYGFTSRVAGTLGYYRTFGTDDLEDADFYGVGITFGIG